MGYAELGKEKSVDNVDLNPNGLSLINQEEMYIITQQTKRVLRQYHIVCLGYHKHDKTSRIRQHKNSSIAPISSSK
jgi:hypothetical protein